jgi:hypothetical protein
LSGRPRASRSNGSVPAAWQRFATSGVTNVFQTGPPNTSSPKGQRAAKIVLLHDPRGAQAAGIDAVLYRELRQYDLLEHFRQGVAAGIGPVPRVFGDRLAMVVEKMPDRRVAADQDDCRAVLL